MTKLAALGIALSTLLLSSMSLKAEMPDLSNIKLRNLAGQAVKLDTLLTDKPIYLKFWASWCQPCRQQMPHLQHTFDQFGKKIDIISVNLGINDSLEEIIKTKKEFNLDLPIYIDESGILAQAVDLIATPYHVVIDSKGNIIHKGHEASAELDNKLQKLANNKQTAFSSTPSHKADISSASLLISDPQTRLIFFTSAWCGWYLEKSRPQMAKNCDEAQKTINTLYQQHPQLHWHGILTRLWTGNKELAEYRKKFDIKHPLIVDSTNTVFLRYQIKTFPTLIAVKGDQELFRLSDFSQPLKAQQLLSRAIGEGS